ncbi:hypothetical protein DFH29DRAFT_1047824 [Suillus ampliporus]|nr:hypothetical protein DFH29DRAFT_1047824 [Suillus ampliporus]
MCAVINDIPPLFDYKQSDFITDRDNLGKLLYWADATTPAPIDIAGFTRLGEQKTETFMSIPSSSRCGTGVVYSTTTTSLCFRVRLGASDFDYRRQHRPLTSLRVQACFDVIDCVEKRTIDPVGLGSQRYHYCTSDTEQKDWQSLGPYDLGYYEADVVTTRSFKVGSINSMSMMDAERPNAKQPTSETKDSPNDNVNQVLGPIIAAINVTRDLVRFDLARGILGAVADILTMVQSVIKNKSDFLVMANQCETIKRVLDEVIKDDTADDPQGSLRHALSELNMKLIAMQNRWKKDLDRVIKLFNFEAIAGIRIDMKFMKMAFSELKGNVAGTNAPKYSLTEPPSRLSMLYGRDDLVAVLTDLVVNDEHIALVGPGGMGKSSLAKAILNEKPIVEKFNHRRFFVTYDGLDPSTITFEAFMTRFAAALGTELAGADPKCQISTFLRSASALVVLDNAETFEEADAFSALSEIPPAIADIPGVILILTSHSRRNASNVPRSNVEGEITNLLEELEFHPLSINLLANAAQQNGWSPAMLLERWGDQHSTVVDHGKGKLQSLSFTLQLSLNSPTVHKLGEDVYRTLAAFLPLGLNESLASNLLPSLPQVDAICDILCMRSLAYRQDNFIKMLSPIRHFVRDLLSPSDSICLGEIRAFYYRTVQPDWWSAARNNHADITILDHLNIEQVVAFYLAHISDSAAGETYCACSQFLEFLRSRLPDTSSRGRALRAKLDKCSPIYAPAELLIIV